MNHVNDIEAFLAFFGVMSLNRLSAFPLEAPCARTNGSKLLYRLFLILYESFASDLVMICGN